jgi:hypothetical protein
MIHKTFLIDAMGLHACKAILEERLGVSFHERETSYNPNYFRCVVDDQRKLKLMLNEDFGGSEIYGKFSTRDLLLIVDCPQESDDILARIIEMPFVKAVDPNDLK